MNETPIFDSLTGPGFKAGSVPAPETLSPKTNTPIFDSLSRPSASAAASGSQTPIFDQLNQPTPAPSVGDILLPKRPEAPPTPPTPEEPGYAGSILRGLYSGFRRRLPEMAGQAMQFTGVGAETGKGITEWAREGEQRPEFKNPLKDWLYQGAEMVAPSLALPVAMSAAGAGVLPASIAAGALFGLSQAQATKETAEKAGKEPGMAPYATGGIEALGETAGTIALQRLFGPLAPAVAKGGKVAIRDVIKPGFSRMMKEFFGVTIPVEVGTEIGQQVGEAAVEKAAGIRDADLIKEGLSVVGPTFILSALTAGMAHPLNRVMSKRFESALIDPETPQEVRQQTVDSISKTLSEADPNLGAMWNIRATMAIMNKEAIPLDQDVSDWFKEFQLTPEKPSPAPGPAAPKAAGEVPSPVTPPQAPPSPVPPPGPGVGPTTPTPTPIPPEAPKTPSPEPVPAPATPMAVPPTPTPAQEPKAPPAPAPSLGGPEWMAIGKKVSFEGKGGSQVGTVRDIVYGPPDGKTPIGVTIETAAGKTLELKPDQVSEPKRIGRQREYREELAKVPEDQRRQVIKDSKEFDRLILEHADLFAERGMIDMMDTRELLDQLRHDVGGAYGLDNPYSPVQRAQALPELKKYMEKARPGSTEKVQIPKTESFLPTTKAQPAPAAPQTVPGEKPQRPQPAPAEEAGPAAAPSMEVTAYHGTGASFAEFTPDTHGDIYFSESEDEARRKGRPGEEAKKLLQARLNIKNPAPDWPTYQTQIGGPYDGVKVGKDWIVKKEAIVGFEEVGQAAAPPKPTIDEQKKKLEEMKPKEEKPAAAPTPSPEPKQPPEAVTTGEQPPRAVPEEKPKEPEAQKPSIEEPGKAAGPVPEKAAAAPAENLPKTPVQVLAQSVSMIVESRIRTGGEAITNTELMQMASKAFGGTRAEGKFTPREAYDGMEMGVNKYILDHASEVNQEFLDKILRILPTEALRTKEMQEFQQFSTPPNIAYVANWLGKVNNRDVFAETSAGNGCLATLAAVENPKVMVLNELDKGRVENLKWLFPNAQVFNENAEHANAIIGPKLTEKPTVAVINPPFSASGGRMPGKKILDIVNAHINEALGILEKGGRLVVITGRGFAPNTPTFKDYFDKLKLVYNIRANIGLDGKNYKKYGTSFDIRMTVIDKTGPTQGEVYGRDYVTPEEMLNDPKLQEIRDGRPEIERAVTGEPKPVGPHVEPGFEEPGTEPGAGKPVLAPTSNVLPGERAGAAPAPGTVRVGGEPGQTQPTEAPGLPGVRPGGEAELPGGERGGELGAGGIGQEVAGQAGGERVVPEQGLPDVPDRQPGIAPENKVVGVNTPEKTTLKDNALYLPARYPNQDMGGEHPTKLVEPVALVDIDPPAVSNIKLNLTPENLKGNAEGKKLSSDQVYIAKMAKRAHGLGFAFFNAGGTGSGKGGGNAATIMDSWNSGKKKHVWISQTKDLQADAKRDWNMIGGKDEDIITLNDVKSNQSVEDYLKAKGKPNQGILFLGYNLLPSQGKKEGSIKRIDQVLNWLGPDFDGVLIFDEAHNMSNGIPGTGLFGRKPVAQKALAGIDLQNKLPNAKVIYSSATGATELQHLVYAQGLKMWGHGRAFADIHDFLAKVGTHGTAGMEMVAADLKRMGLYLAPSISFEGVTQEKLTHSLIDDQKTMYNDIAKMWQKVLHNIQSVMEATGANLNPAARRNSASIFWGAQQRFFSQMLLAMQMPSVVQHAKEQMNQGYSSVFQLVNTNEANQTRALERMEEEQEYEELDLSPKEILFNYLQHAFPIHKYEEYTDENGNVRSRLVLDSNKNPVVDPKALAARDALLTELGGMKFPENPLDYLVKEIGSENIAEVTGRKERLIWKEGKRVKEDRTPKIIKGDVQGFYDDKRRALVFSSKGATGFSYDSDKSFINQRKRIHYLIQAGWQAAAVFQGIGRTHRANEATPPHIVRCSIDVPSAQRFDASIARRLEQLGAISKGQRQTTSQGLFNARENLENAQARAALARFYVDLYAGGVSELTLGSFANQTGLKLTDENTGQLLEQLPPIQQFLNRMLSMELDQQGFTFDHFSQLLDRQIEADQKAGRLDLGLQNLHALSTEVLSDKVVHTDAESAAKTNLVHLKTTHEAPVFTHQAMTGWAEGVIRNVKSGKIWAMGKAFNRTKADGSVERVNPLRSANYTSEYIKSDELQDSKKWKKIPKDQIKTEWETAVDEAPKTMTREHYMISGMKLPIWDRMGTSGGLWRFQLPDGSTQVGKEIHPSELEQTLQKLNAEADAVKMTPGEVFEHVMDGNKVITLANGWKFRRTKSYGDERMEIVGPDDHFHNYFRTLGVSMELIQFQTRYFIPTDKAKATDILEKLLLNRPITSVADRTSNKVFAIEMGGETRGAQREPRAEAPAELNKEELDSLDRFNDDEISILKTMFVLKPGKAENGALVYIPDIRQKLTDRFKDKQSFDLAIMSLAEKEILQLQSNSLPAALSTEDRSAMIDNGRGSYFMAAGIRQEPEIAISKLQEGAIKKYQLSEEWAETVQGAPQSDLEQYREPGAQTWLSAKWERGIKGAKNGKDIVSFVAQNSPVTGQRLLAQALLANKNIAEQLEDLPVKADSQPGEGSYYQMEDHSVHLSMYRLATYTEEYASAVALHESVHGLTSRKIRENDQFFSTVTRLRETAKRALSPNDLGILNFRSQKQVGFAGVRDIRQAGLTEHHHDIYYGLQNNDEFLSTIFASPHMQEFLKGIPLPENMQTREVKTLWDQFMEFISRVIFGSPGYRTVLSEALTAGGEIMRTTEKESRQLDQEEYNRRPMESNTRFFAIDDPGLPLGAQDNLDAITDPHLSNHAAADKGFVKWLHDKTGILYIPNKDLGIIEQYLSLPYYMSKKYPVFRKLLHTQTTREEARSDGINQFLEASSPFLTMKGPEVQKVEKALIAGDQEKVVYTPEELRERFGLTNTGIESYVSVRTTLDAMLNRWADHAEWALLRPYEKRLNGEEYQQLVGIYKTVLTPNEIAALPQKVARAYQRLQPGVNLIKRIRSRVAELKGYFPRYREPGKYYVTVKETQTDEQGNERQVTTFTTFASSEWEATKIVNALKEEKEPNETIMYGRHTQEAESSFFGTSDTNLQRLVDNAIGEVKKSGQISEDQGNELRYQLSQSLAEMMLARGAGARMIKRSNNLIAGYQTDQLQQVLKNYIVGYMGMETKQDASYDFLDNLSEVPKGQPNLFTEASHYVDTMLRNYDKQDQGFSKVRALAFTYYLAGSIRAAVVQMTQNFVTGIPFLGRELKGMNKGLMAAERYYIKAMKDIAFGNLTQDEKAMDHEVLSKGIANDQLIRSITAEIGGSMNETMYKVSRILAAPFSKMEIFNRRAAALARYRVAQEQGLNFEESMDKIRDYVNDTHYLMTKANLPHAARGGDIPSKLIGTAYTFRRFTHNYILSMIYSLRGPDGKFNIRNVDVFFHSIAWLMLFGGMAALPFLDDLLDEAEKFFGSPYRQNIRNWMRQVGGQPMERAGVAGLPALLGQIPGMVGFDISGSLRIGFPSLTSPMKGASETVFGVWGGLGQKMTRAYQEASVGDYLRAFEFASPAMIENILKATRMSTMGATTPEGHTMFNVQGQPIKETPGEAAEQMMGFRPERIAQMSEERRTFKNVETYFSGKRNDLYTRFRLAKTTEDRQDVIKDVQKYNLEASKYRGAIPMINADSLRRSFKEKPEKNYLVWGLQGRQ